MTGIIVFATPPTNRGHLYRRYDYAVGDRCVRVENREAMAVTSSGASCNRGDADNLPFLPFLESGQVRRLCSDGRPKTRHNYTVEGVLAALLLLTSCRVEMNSGPPRFALTGPENWVIGDRRYSLQETYVMPRIDLPGAPLQFTVEYTCGECAFAKMTDLDAMNAALPLMRYAYEEGVYKRSKVTVNGVPTEPLFIGVVLVEPGTRGQKGYRIARSIAELSLPHIP